MRDRGWKTRVAAGFLPLLLSCAVLSFAAQGKGKKAAGKKPRKAAASPAQTAPATPAAPPEKAAAPAQAAPAASAPSPEKTPGPLPPSAASPGASPAPADQSLDVTITGESKDEVPLVKPPPSVDISFDQVAGLSREGQTDRVLTGPVEHMTGQDQMSLLQVDSRQAFLGMPARIPSTPFIRMEISPGLSPSSWELQILDQDDKALKALEGTVLPKYLLEWDGFQSGVFKLRPGPAYTPVLMLTDERKRTQRYYGEPVHFAALQYVQDGVLHVEFDNNRLFERGRGGFSTDMTPYLQASLNLLRQRVGKPIRVVLYAAPGGSALPAKRLENLKTFYKEGLALENDLISFAVQPTKDRGDITEITVMSHE